MCVCVCVCVCVHVCSNSDKQCEYFIGSPGSASYSMSKHALHVSLSLRSSPLCLHHTVSFAPQGFFDTLRMEIADSGVTVHMVCPGPVDTPYFKRHFGAAIGKVYTAILLTQCHVCTLNLDLTTTKIGAIAPLSCRLQTYHKMLARRTLLV